MSTVRWDPKDGGQRANAPPPTRLGVPPRGAPNLNLRIARNSDGIAEVTLAVHISGKPTSSKWFQAIDDSPLQPL